MLNQTFEPYASIIESSRLIDRDEILDEIQRSLEDPSEKTHLYYITAGGGAGKTRLLREVLNRANKKKRAGKILAPADPVDLYHIDTRSEEGLALKIANGLGQEYFSAFLKARQDFARKKYQIAGSYRDIKEYRRIMMQTFLDDYHNLYTHSDRILVALDTVETWVWLYEPDHVQQALGIAHSGNDSSSWTINDFLPNIKKSVVLIAGRPVSEQLEKDLQGLADKNPGIVFHRYEINSFTEDESLEYFTTIQKDARKKAPHTANLIASIPKDMRLVIHHLSSGQPLLLAMSIDYLANTRRVAPLFEMTPAEALAKTATKELRTAVKEEMQKALIQGIQEAYRPLDQVIRALGWLPKGLNAPMLAWIEQEGPPSEEQILGQERVLQELAKDDQRLTFIKIRPEDKRVFLHDELYALFEKIHLQYPPETGINIHRIIGAYYRSAISDARNKIAEYLQNQMTRILSAPEEQPTALDAADDIRFMELKIALQELMVEDLSYTLRKDPVEGFHKYIRYAEEAFQTLDETFWVELRGELKKFFEDTTPWWDSPSKAEVEGEIGIGWIRYSIMRMEYTEALDHAQNFRQKCPDLFKDNIFLNHLLDIWIGQCYTYLARSKQEMEEAKTLFNKGENFFDVQKNSEDDFTRWRASTARADVEINLGYLNRSLGGFKSAIDPYRTAILEYREVKNEAGQANALNNLAWAEAETGKFDAAIDHCQDGLDMRRNSQHGTTYAVALSLNTLGLIKMRDGKAKEAEDHCRQALHIFRDLEEPRGIGLANTALAEIIRRSNPDEQAALTAPARLLGRLKEAEVFAREAATIFEELDEPLRIVEAYLELGCVYREMARYMKPASQEQKENFDLGRTALEKAAQEAQGRFDYRAYDALVNLAFLYYFAGLPIEAAGIFKEKVLEKMNPQYLFKPKAEHPGKAVKDPVYWYWVQLGKGYSLLGRIAFDRFSKTTQPEENETALGYLDESVQNWVLSLEYNALYGTDFRDMRRSKTRIYDCLKKLNASELRRAKQTAESIKAKYRLKEGFLFSMLLEERFGIKVNAKAPYTQE